MLKPIIAKLLVLILFVSACVPKKDLVYLQPNDEDEPSNFTYNRNEYRLQVNDILDVQVRSVNEESNKMFNQGQVNSGQQMQVSANGGGDVFYITGYSINDSGMVDLPIMGKIDVLGKTIQEAQIAIEDRVKKYFSMYYLKVQLGGIRYAALGEFNAPGKYVILQNQVTIFEAIANARDLTMVADRDEIVLIRQYPDGTRVHRLNLLDQSIINSPFYFIQPNDVIYAEPLPQKSFGLGINGAQTISTIVSIVSTSLALILAIQALNN